MNSKQLKEYTKNLINKYVSQRNVFMSTDTVTSYPGFLEDIIKKVHKDTLKEGRECLKKWKQMAWFIEIHDLMLNPKDLPEKENDKPVWYIVLDKNGNHMFARFVDSKWRNYTVIDDVVAWCKAPVFKMEITK